MKRQRSEPFDIPPVDGGILLRSKQWVAIDCDPPPARNPIVLAQAIKHIRGGILSSSIEVENALINLEMANIYGKEVDRGRELQGFAEIDRARRGENSLHRKIERSKDIYRKHLSKNQADKIIQRLSDYRKLRNLMGHYPSWLEPVNDEDRRITLDFIPMIGDQSHIWTIDQAQVQEWGDLIVEVVRDATRLNFRLKGAPEPKFFEKSSGVMGDFDLETGIGTASPLGTVFDVFNHTHGR